jgi:hypothetical protein
MLKRQHRPKRCPTVLGTPTIIAQLLFTVVPPPADVSTDTYDQILSFTPSLHNMHRIQLKTQTLPM